MVEFDCWVVLKGSLSKSGLGAIAELFLGVSLDEDYWVLGHRAPFLHFHLVEGAELAYLSLAFHDFPLVKGDFALQGTHSAPLEVLSGPLLRQKHLVLSFELLEFVVMLKDGRSRDF